MKKLFLAFIEFISLKLISPAKWTFVKFFFTGRAYDLKPVDREYARDLMKQNVFLWVSRRETHLTTYLISFSDYALSLVAWAKNKFKGQRPRFGYWSHAFINYDDNEIYEAVSKGVQKVFFDSVFDCDAVAALLPRFVSPLEWAEVLPLIKEELELHQKGKKYDTIFNLSDESKVSCIELIRLVLKKNIKDYEIKFKDFEDMIKANKNVTPQMLYDSKSFQVVYEVRY